MKIIALQAENIKRLVAVEIRPDGNVVEITGHNGSGKTSVLDSLWWGLTGAANIQAVPIRHGQDQARIRVDLGELVVTRTFKRKDDGDYTTQLSVQNADGGKLSSPQSILDALVGELSFDPLEFTRLRPREQFDRLKGFVPGIDFDALDAADRRDYEARTDVNREIKRLEAQAEAIEIPDDLPDEMIDDASILKQAEDARQASAYEQKASENRKEAAALLQRAEEYERDAHNLRRGLDDDAENLAERLLQARAINAAIQDRDRRARLIVKRDQFHFQSGELTGAMKAREMKRQAAIAAAQMPVDGIGFGDGEILLNDVPFNQASDAEQLKASVAIAMAMNPKLKVVRVRDGSLLDADSMQTLVSMADGNDYQIWVETVASNAPGAVVIEDGAVKSEASHAMG